MLIGARTLKKTTLSGFLAADSLEALEQTYDEVAEQYERDLLAMGYRLPAMVAAAFAKFVPTDATPILDAGCGGGLQAEPLAMLGYGPLIGIDLSEGMLSVAKSKRIYAELQRMKLGERLDFSDDTFGAVVCCGAISPRHAPVHSFNELIRVAKPGAVIVFSLRDDDRQESEYRRLPETLERDDRWRFQFRTASFSGMPGGDVELSHRVYVYKVLC